MAAAAGVAEMGAGPAAYLDVMDRYERGDYTIDPVTGKMNMALRKKMPPRPDRQTADRIDFAIRNDCFSVGSPEFCGTISTEQRPSDASLAFYSSGKRI